MNYSEPDHSCSGTAFRRLVSALRSPGVLLVHQRGAESEKQLPDASG
jgi:hypothetical protein